MKKMLLLSTLLLCRLASITVCAEEPHDNEMAIEESVEEKYEVVLPEGIVSVNSTVKDISIFRSNQIEAVNSTTPVSDVDESDVYLLAKVMIHEAGYEGDAGLCAVAEVVYNRLNSNYFPDTVEEVIFQKNQFMGADELKYIKPTIEALNIARNILGGKEGVLKDKHIFFFRNAGGSTEDWGKYKYEKTINHHQFYSYYGYDNGK